VRYSCRASAPPKVWAGRYIGILDFSSVESRLTPAPLAGTDGADPHSISPAPQIADAAPLAGLTALDLTRSLGAHQIVERGARWRAHVPLTSPTISVATLIADAGPAGRAHGADLARFYSETPSRPTRQPLSALHGADLTRSPVHDQLSVC